MSESDVDPAQVASEVDALERSEQSLVAHLRSLAPVDPAAPTVLPGWTLGHVLTHIARNADSMLRMLAGLGQYWKGLESRAADIELGSGRPWSELVDDIEATSEAVVRRMREVTDWTGSIRSTRAERPKAMAPMVRRGEVEIHHTDLGLGYDFVDMPADFVRAEGRRLEMTWKARQPMGLTEFPETVLRLAPHERLAWLCGRRVVDGVEPAGVF